MPPGTRAASAWLALVAVLAGCSDEPPTAPPAAGAARAPAAVAHAPVRQEAPAAPGTLVLRRTTSSARGAKGGRTERRETWAVAESALSRRAGVVTLRGTSPKALTPETAASFLPALVLQLPARAASAVCTNAPAWQRESKVGDLTVVTRGRGDEPWSSVEVWSAGRLVTRTRTEWARYRGSWRLASQEDVAVGDGATRTLTVDRSALARAQDDVLPAVSCANPKSGYVPPSPVVASVRGGIAAPWSAGLGPVGLAGLELAGAFRFAAEETCTPTEEEAEAACASQLLKLIASGAGVVAAGGALFTACVAPTVFEPVACLGAFALYNAAVANAESARLEYEECKEQARAPKPCSCPATAPASDVGGVVAARTSHDGPTLPGAARFALDCTEPEPAPSGGGGGTTPPPSTGHYIEICTYVDYYDENGWYLYTEYLECRLEWVE